MCMFSPRCVHLNLYIFSLEEQKLDCYLFLFFQYDSSNLQINHKEKCQLTCPLSWSCCCWSSWSLFFLLLSIDSFICLSWSSLCLPNLALKLSSKAFCLAFNLFISSSDMWPWLSTASCEISSQKKCQYWLGSDNSKISNKFITW